MSRKSLALPGGSEIPPFPPLKKGGCEKIDLVLFGVRRRPESRFFTNLRIDWTPVFTGVTNEFQFFHSFRGAEEGFKKAISKS
jgi:hypothetical protein